MNEITLKESIVSTAHRKFGELVAKKRLKKLAQAILILLNIKEPFEIVKEAEEASEKSEKN